LGEESLISEMIGIRISDDGIESMRNIDDRIEDKWKGGIPR